MGRRIGSGGRAEISVDGGMMRQARSDRGWTQAELARRAGISRATVSLIEGRGQRVTDHLANSLAAALDMSSPALSGGAVLATPTPFAIEVAATNAVGTLHAVTTALASLGLDIRALETSSDARAGSMKVSVHAARDIGVGALANRLANLPGVTDVRLTCFFLTPRTGPTVPRDGQIALWVSGHDRSGFVRDVAEVAQRLGMNMERVAVWVERDVAHVWFTSSPFDASTGETLKRDLARISGFETLCITVPE